MGLLTTSNVPVQVESAEMLYRFALDCAEHKIRNNCNFQCHTCASNLELYGLNKKEALLLNHTAELEIDHRIKLQHSLKMQELRYHEKVQRNNNISKLMNYFMLFLFLVCVLFSVWAFKNLKVSPPRETMMPDDQYINYLPDIFETLRRIYDVDMNHDGLINCIDMAIQFYNAYPERDLVRIIVNHHPTNGFNHLFVYVAGVCIEPAALLRTKDPNKINLGVGDYWGSLYDTRYDQDVTAHWAEIRVNKYRW
jgi:hypothetical protein